MPALFLTFSLSLMFLIVSANLLLKFIEKFSKRIKISPLIVGATLIAIGTSLPETFVAFSSIAQNAADISYGDILGSNIANICLVLGLGIFLFPVRVGTEKTQRNNIIMLLTTAYFMGVLLAPPAWRKLLGIFPVFFYLAFLVVEIIWGEVGRLKEDKKALAKMPASRGSTPMYLVGILASMAGLIISSHFLVSSVISLSKLLGISEAIIGLSVVAVGTSLPELATTIMSGIDKDWKLLYGDIQGSNIYNLSIIGAFLLTFSSTDYQISPYTLVALSAATISIIYLSYKYEGTHIPRLYGLGYLAVYALYIFKIYNI